MMAEEPYVGKPLVRFREGRGGNWQSSGAPRLLDPAALSLTLEEERGQAHLPDLKSGGGVK